MVEAGNGRSGEGLARVYNATTEYSCLFRSKSVNVFQNPVFVDVRSTLCIDAVCCQPLPACRHFRELYQFNQGALEESVVGGGSNSIMLSMRI